MKSWLRWTFRVLFVLMIFYHIWNFYSFGLDAFKVLRPNLATHISVISKLLVMLVFLLGNLINYIFQIVLPIIFFYFGFIYKGDEYQEFKNPYSSGNNQENEFKFS